MADKKITKRNDEDRVVKFRRQRRKFCALCKNKELELDFKNAEQLQRFISEKGKILPRRVTGTCSRHQREVTRVIKRARQLGVLPYSAN